MNYLVMLSAKIKLVLTLYLEEQYAKQVINFLKIIIINLTAFLLMACMNMIRLKKILLIH